MFLFHNKRRQIVIVTFLLIFQCNKSLAFFNNTIFCHNIVQLDDLPTADDHGHFFPEKSIFFIETSCQGGLNSRQACAIESAAKLNPNWQINVLFTSPVSKPTQNGITMTLLRLYQNIKMLRIHVARFGEGTPLANILASGILKQSRWPVVHSSDVLRFLTMYKFGGIYMDLDVIVIKPFDTLDKNWLAKENDWQIGSAYLSISRDQFGKQLAAATIRELETNLRFDDFAYNGPSLLRRVMKRTICSTKKVPKMTADNCKGINLYNRKYFFFYPIDQWEMYFIPGYFNITDTYAIHTWNSVSKTATVSKHSPYAKLSKMFCPKMQRVHRRTNWRI